MGNLYRHQTNGEIAVACADGYKIGKFTTAGAWRGSRRELQLPAGFVHLTGTLAEGNRWDHLRRAAEVVEELKSDMSVQDPEADRVWEEFDHDTMVSLGPWLRGMADILEHGSTEAARHARLRKRLLTAIYPHAVSDRVAELLADDILGAFTVKDNK